MAMTDHENVILMAMSNNDLMPPDSRTKAHALILDAETEIRQFDNEIIRLSQEITRMQSAIKDIQRKRKETAAKIGQYQPTVAPHRAVPNEVLAEIFLHCNPEYVAIPWDLTQSPWIISYVCGKWRSVALGMPILWQSISVNNGPLLRPKISVNNEFLGHHQIDMMREVFLRGGNIRISLISTSGIHASETLRFVATNLSSFKSLSIQGDLSAMMPILSSLPGRSRELEQLDITCPQAGPKLHLTFLEGASRLQKLAIREARDIPASSLLRLSLSKITVLDLPHGPLGSDDMFALLSRCRFVEQCTIGLLNKQYLAQPMPTQSRPLTLPHLKTFTICPDRNAFPAFLADLIMPRLSEFHMTGTTLWTIEFTTQWTMEFTAALSHSPCLQILHLESSLSETDLDILLPAMPDIRSLVISRVSLSAHILKRIARGEVIPKMYLFDAKYGVQTWEALDLYLEMFEQKLHPADQLTLLLPSHFGNAPSELVRRFHKMKGVGWKFRTGVRHRWMT